MSRQAEHEELMMLVLAAVAKIQGVPRDRFEAFVIAQGETFPTMDPEDSVYLYDTITDLVDVDFRPAPEEPDDA